MDNADRCPYCGQDILKHKHPFSRSLANILIRATQKFGPKEPFHLQHDLFLTKSEYNNFQKLRYWGLVEKARDGQGKRRGGYWSLTWKALELLNGEEIYKWVITFNNAIVDYSIKKITLQQTVGYFEIPERWAKRAEAQKVWL